MENYRLPDMVTKAFDKKMTISEAQRILIHALVNDKDHFEDYEKDFDEWLMSDRVIHSLCG